LQVSENGADMYVRFGDQCAFVVETGFPLRRDDVDRAGDDNELVFLVDVQRTAVLIADVVATRHSTDCTAPISVSTAA